MQRRNAVCVMLSCPHALGGIWEELEMEHQGMSFEGMSQNTHHSFREMFPPSSSSPWHSVLAIAVFLGHGLRHHLEKLKIGEKNPVQVLQRGEHVTEHESQTASF